MKLFSSRLRKTDELAMVLAFEEPERRLEFALNTIRMSARPDTRRPGVLVAKVVPEDVARVALVDKEQAEVFLKKKQDLGEIKLRPLSIQFFPQTGK